MPKQTYLTVADQVLVEQFSAHEKAVARLRWGGIPLDLEFVRNDSTFQKMLDDYRANLGFKTGNPKA